MSVLKKGTRCVIIGGCPGNIGLIVEVISHPGKTWDREDAYCVSTVTGRFMNQIWSGKNLVKGFSQECITDRHKLRPLVDPKDDVSDDEEIELPIKQILKNLIAGDVMV